MRKPPVFPEGWNILAMKAIDEADTAFAVIRLCDDLTPQAKSALARAWCLVQDAYAATMPNGAYAAAVKESRAEAKVVHATVTGIDYPLFTKQKEAVASLVMDRAGHIGKKEQELLDGLLGLLDAITDDVLARHPHLGEADHA